ncbi:hypothetical protein BLH37_16030, partial [Listeria monocytogenes]|nr:hypothetical protein [Listeria monocytogenes]
MNINENLISEDKLVAIKREKKKKEIFKNVPYSLKEEYEIDGWIVDRELKSLIKMKRAKSPQLLFKNKVWLTFCN